MYKVFVENRPVIFTQNSENYSQSLCVKAIQVEDILELVCNNVSKISHESPLIIQCDRTEVDVNRLFFHYERVNAAGGVVCRGDEILMIYKNGMWDLPKGFVDNGETFEQAACREISEECGIEGQQLDRKLMETWHTYRYLDGLVLKQSHWYVFHYSGTKKTLPQQEEGILEAVWMSKNQLNTLLDNCYGSVRDVLDYFWHNASN